MPSSMQDALQAVFSKDISVRVLLVKHFAAGDMLLPTAQDGYPPERAILRTKNGATVVKLFVRTTGEQAPDSPSPTAGTDVGMEFWFPDVSTWNHRIYVQILGGMMGDFRVTSTGHASLSICSEHDTPQLATELGFVVASTDGGHVSDSMEDMSYLLNADGSYNLEGFKNVSFQATHLLAQAAKSITRAYYDRNAKASYLFGCSTGGRQAYHSAQKYPEDFDGILSSCPSITQSFLFPSLGHPHIIVNNDLDGQGFTIEQLDIVAQKAMDTTDTAITGQHDGYFTTWDDNVYDPTQDRSILAVSEGGDCTESWAFTRKQCQAINKIWYGPTFDGQVPDPRKDNGTGYIKSSHQLWWGKLRGTEIEFAQSTRDIVGNHLAVVLKDVSMAPPSWNHPLGKGENAWTKFTHKEYAQAMLRCREVDDTVFHMDADNPDLRPFRDAGKKMITYHGLADSGVAPQSAIRYYHAVNERCCGADETQDFHRLFLIPGMGHCLRERGTAGRARVPLPTLEQMIEMLIAWVEEGKFPEKIIAYSHDNTISRPIMAYPRLPKYDGEGDPTQASSFI